LKAVKAGGNSAIKDKILVLQEINCKKAVQPLCPISNPPDP
jgi:hypothetical protein